MHILISQWTLVGLIACGVAHLLLVVIPAAIMGFFALAIILSDKKLRDPASILLVCITIQCILGPLAYGLLTDLGLITNVPFWILRGNWRPYFCVLLDHISGSTHEYKRSSGYCAVCLDSMEP